MHIHADVTRIAVCVFPPGHPRWLHYRLLVERGHDGHRWVVTDGWHHFMDSDGSWHGKFEEPDDAYLRALEGFDKATALRLAEQAAPLVEFGDTTAEQEAVREETTTGEEKILLAAAHGLLKTARALSERTDLPCDAATTGGAATTGDAEAAFLRELLREGIAEAGESDDDRLLSEARHAALDHALYAITCALGLRIGGCDDLFSNETGLRQLAAMPLSGAAHVLTHAANVTSGVARAEGDGGCR